jgi:hypothetical protein
MLTIHEFALHGSYKASDDFSIVLKDLEARLKMLYTFRQRYNLKSSAVVKELCYAVK